jgi:hypothetical protein
MGRNLKVGDLVQIATPDEIPYSGWWGVIIKISDATTYSYEVEFKDGEIRCYRRDELHSEIGHVMEILGKYEEDGTPINP